MIREEIEKIKAILYSHERRDEAKKQRRVLQGQYDFYFYDS